MTDALTLTPKQRRLARHMLGFQGDARRKVSYRNRFVTGTPSPDHPHLGPLVERGFAKFHARSGTYFLTRAGAEAALNPGETLSKEDFPDE